MVNCWAFLGKIIEALKQPSAHASMARCQPLLAFHSDSIEDPFHKRPPQFSGIGQWGISARFVHSATVHQSSRTEQHAPHRARLIHFSSTLVDLSPGKTIPSRDFIPIIDGSSLGSEPLGNT
jgi:hypothetical protein